jgi:hypothetical protein
VDSSNSDFDLALSGTLDHDFGLANFCLGSEILDQWMALYVSRRKGICSIMTNSSPKFAPGVSGIITFIYKNIKQPIFFRLL